MWRRLPACGASPGRVRRLEACADGSNTAEGGCATCLRRSLRLRRLARGVALGEELGDEGFELAAGLDGGELAVGVDDEDAGDRVDAPRLGELAVPEVALVVLGPLDVVLGDEVLELLQAAGGFGLVEAHADELDALVLVFAIDFLVVGHLGDARTAP